MPKKLLRTCPDQLQFEALKCVGRCSRIRRFDTIDGCVSLPGYVGCRAPLAFRFRSPSPFNTSRCLHVATVWMLTCPRDLDYNLSSTTSLRMSVCTRRWPPVTDHRSQEAHIETGISECVALYESLVCKHCRAALRVTCDDWRSCSHPQVEGSLIKATCRSETDTLPGRRPEHPA